MLSFYRKTEERKDGEPVENTGGKGKRWKALIYIAFFLILGSGSLFFYFQIYKVVPAFHEMTCEYGDPVSQNIEDYLTGTDWSVHLGELDLSGVDEGNTGTYQAVVRHGRSEFIYEVTIRDTTAPEIVWKDKQIYLARGAVCTTEDFIDGISDADSQAKAFLADGDSEQETMQFDQTGQYDVEVVARDGSGNETRGLVSVIVDTAPVLGGIHDFYCVPGSEPDYLDEVTAWDDVDGDLTAEIRVDDSGVDLDRPGEYSLCYVSEDRYGLETVEEARVLVASAEEIQALIGRREIDYREDTILGAPNIYDAGASAHEDVDETLEYMRPALVQLYHGVGRGGYSSGSGYIMEITEDKIYICSNHHVVSKYEDWDVYFFDGTRVRGRAVGTSSNYDVGVAEGSLEDVPEELLEKLMTVHIDRTYWESLNQQDIGIGLERVDREGGILHISKGQLIKVKQQFDWNTHADHTEVTVELIHGDSGSAVLDGYGNLICMAFAYSTDPVRFWCIPLDGILECYKEITGRMPYVY